MSLGVLTVRAETGVDDGVLSFSSERGDVNGDGYDDVIVGADGYSSNTGK